MTASFWVCITFIGARYVSDMWSGWKLLSDGAVTWLLGQVGQNIKFVLFVEYNGF
jgi:hypothetical protein